MLLRQSSCSAGGAAPASSAAAPSPTRHHISRPTGWPAPPATHAASACSHWAAGHGRPAARRRRGLAQRCSAAAHHDPYVAAAYRLQSLISGVGDGEDELYTQLLLEEDPNNKLQVNAVLAALVLTASTTICWLCGKDPAGGASLSLHSLQAAAVGALAALPLVAYKLVGWSRPGQASDATLAVLRRQQVDTAKPWVAGMDRAQLGLHLVLDTLPTLFLLLPAAQAGLTTTFAATSAALGRSTGVELPPEFGFCLALTMTALVQAAVRSTELMADPQQVSVVGDAVANADRFYKLMAGSTNSSSSSSSDPAAAALRAEAEAARAAMAFKAVAVSWREQEQEVARLFMTLQVVDFVYLGCLWLSTGDMTAPCVAALLANSVDYYYCWRGLRQGRDGGDAGSSGPGRSSSTSGGGSGQRAQRE